MDGTNNASREFNSNIQTGAYAMKRMARIAVITLVQIGLIMVAPDVRRTSVAQAQGDSLCEVLRKYVESARQNFASVKGPMTDKDEYGTSYRAKYDVPGFRDCTITVFSDMEPSLSCKATVDDLEELFNKIKPCFQSWRAKNSSSSTTEQYELAGPNGVRVRLRKTGSIRLYVDAPSRD
jgi:hypothetical protein